MPFVNLSRYYITNLFNLQLTYLSETKTFYAWFNQNETKVRFHLKTAEIERLANILEKEDFEQEKVSLEPERSVEIFKNDAVFTLKYEDSYHSDVLLEIEVTETQSVKFKKVVKEVAAVIKNYRKKISFETFRNSLAPYIASDFMKRRVDLCYGCQTMNVDDHSCGETKAFGKFNLPTYYGTAANFFLESDKHKLEACFGELAEQFLEDPTQIESLDYEELVYKTGLEIFEGSLFEKCPLPAVLRKLFIDKYDN